MPMTATIETIEKLRLRNSSRCSSGAGERSSMTTNATSSTAPTM